jgi:hypothetical protein
MYMPSLFKSANALAGRVAPRSQEIGSQMVAQRPQLDYKSGTPADTRTAS